MCWNFWKYNMHRTVQNFVQLYFSDGLPSDSVAAEWSRRECDVVNEQEMSKHSKGEHKDMTKFCNLQNTD